MEYVVCRLDAEDTHFDNLDDALIYALDEVKRGVDITQLSVWSCGEDYALVDLFWSGHIIEFGGQ